MRIVTIPANLSGWAQFPIMLERVGGCLAQQEDVLSNMFIVREAQYETLGPHSSCLCAAASGTNDHTMQRAELGIHLSGLHPVGSNEITQTGCEACAVMASEAHQVGL